MRVHKVSFNESELCTAQKNIS